MGKNRSKLMQLTKADTIINLDTLEEMKKLLAESTEHHKKVSEIKTPKNQIKQKMGMDYVEYPYMRRIADKYYPGWSWKVIKTELIGDKAFMVHGRLLWIDNGLPRQGDVTAAHRIQKKKDSDEYVDIGNDVKAANTDAIKKAFNMYLNIADDVYKAADTELDDNQKEVLINATKEISPEMENKIKNQIENLEIDKTNFDAALRKLRKLKENKNG